MPNLLKNEGISFLAAKNFTYAGEEYVMGQEFPQEKARNIETLVRSRFVIPVLEEGHLRPRHWHTHVRTREEAEEYLNRDRTQLVWPTPPDSNEVVDLDVLTYPETTPEPTQEGTATESGAGEDQNVPGEEYSKEAPAEAAHSEQYDPSYHTVIEVNAHLAQEHDQAERERILQAEEDGRGRKGILEA